MLQIPSEYELFNDITGMELNTKVTEQEFLQQIQEYEKEFAAYELDSQRKEFAFDLMFNKHQADREAAGIDQSSEEESEEEEEPEDDEGEELEQEMGSLSVESGEISKQKGTSDT